MDSKTRKTLRAVENLSLDEYLENMTNYLELVNHNIRKIKKINDFLEFKTQTIESINNLEETLNRYL